MSALPAKADMGRTSFHVRFGRVEDGRGNLGHAATLRFPSPLIEPDVPISGIRLSDWLHREAHGEKFGPQASSARRLPLLRLAIQLSLKGPDHSRCLQAYRQSPSPRHLRKRTRSQGPFPPPALPGFNGRMTLSDSRQSRRLSATLRPLPSLTRSHPITRIIFPTCRAHYPGGSSGCSCRLLPRSHGLPQMAGGSASALSLSRPAQASHA